MKIPSSYTARRVAPGLRALLSALLLALLSGSVACHGSPSPSPSSAAPVTCDGKVTAVPSDTFEVSDVAVAIETEGDAGLAIVAADLAMYLRQMWSAPSLTVASHAPDFSRAVTIWLSTSAAAKARAGSTIVDGYAMKRVEENGKTTLVVYAPDAKNLAFGAYALLERLGARFFHPKEELIPSLPAPRLPHTLDITRAPSVRSRGLQVHTLHPLDTFPVFSDPGAEDFADAQRFVDWLVKTGQNYFQWVELSTVHFDSWKPYAQSILNYAHSRGVSVGANVQLWGGAALQNNYVLVSDATQWQAEMSRQLDTILEVPWDTLELALGEFISGDPQQIIDWLNYAVTYSLSKRPTMEVNVQNHVGNYPDLWVQYDGQTEYYYHLPRYADPRLGQTVHTLFFFDLYRDWATYAHPNFYLQRNYILQEIPTRRVKYFPEAAYWLSADIDVPLFLPEYIYARWLDIHTLTAELIERNLPPLEGHLTFNSGHEWNYWLTDYLTAKMLWEPEQPFEYFLDQYASAFGSCQSEIASALSSFVDLQTQYLFDDKLVGYVEGENLDYDIGQVTGLQIHPERVPYPNVLAMSAKDRASFDSEVVTPLAAFADAIVPLEDKVRAECAGADASVSPWCNELYDGIEIVRLRAQHGVDLYKAVLDKAANETWKSDYDAALAITTTAKEVIARREAHYRYGLDRDTAHYANPTIYDFGYLRPAHTACYWQRNESQVLTLLTTGKAADMFSLPTCQD